MAGGWHGSLRRSNLPPVRLVAYTPLKASPETDFQRAGSVHLRGISPDIQRLAKAEAARRGVTLSEFVSQAIIQATGVFAADAERRLAPIARERKWYEAHREELTQKYDGMFVAISDDGVLCVGETLIAVASEVRQRIGHRPVFVVHVTSTPKRRLGPSPARGAA